MKDSLKVKCKKCGAIYWIDLQYGRDKDCVHCHGTLQEYMENQSDYDRKKQLDLF